MQQKIKLAIKKELLYYSLTLVALALIMHSDLLSDPFLRLSHMQDKGNYSHPFIYASIVYGAFFILRKTIDFIARKFEKNNN
jgi:hypothetical protein